jgi:catechol 2,3-dioxygenase-like lactoylglutathione lyase family enzyme
MPLSSYAVGAVVAVSDMARARDFYEGKLGLSAAADDPDGGRTYACSGGTTIHIFQSPGNAGRSSTTVAGWTVENLEPVVDDLASKGVKFEQYDSPPFVTNAKGIAVVGNSKTAWFKDPDGNILGIIQP